jgi:rubrerythrin
MNEAAVGDLTHEQLMSKVLSAETEAYELLERAAHATADAEERALFERLARREHETLVELQKEEERLEAEEFVQRALDC